MKTILRPIFLMVVILLCASLAFGQSDRGTITGTVTDPSGAIVPNAKITATNLDTGEVRDASSTSSGSYTLPELKAGPYKLSVEAAGFQVTKSENMQLAVQSTRRVDFQLQIGTAQQTVTVEANAPTIQTENATLQSNVTERQVKELPLAVGAETAGRTPLAFIFLDSNVTGTGGNSTDSSHFRVAGGQALGTEILIDGASTRRQQNGTFFSEVAPGPNAFQEFTVSTSTYSAEYGNSTGGVVNFTIKSGGNGYHGEAYELFRNEALNANSFFNKAQTPIPIPKPRDRQNNYGANIGGPIRIPWLYNGKDKSFFFFNYEGFKVNTTENVFVSVPTEKMRTGDFSELLTDPAVLARFPGGVKIFDNTMAPGARTAIPGNRLDTYNGGALIDPVGKNIISFYPHPTRAGVVHNYAANTSSPINMDQYTTKGDQVISDKQRFSVSYSYRKQHAVKPNGQGPRFPEPYVGIGSWDQTFSSHFFRFQHDYTFTPTFLNHLNVGWTRYVVANRNFTEGFDNTTLGLSPTATQRKAFPFIEFPGYGDPVTSTDPRAYNGIGSSFFSDSLKDNGVSISDFATYVVGRHTFKAGAEFRPQQFNVHQLIDPGGHFNFRNGQTSNGGADNEGWPIASLITGATEFSFNTVNSIDPGWRQFSSSYFVNDDWKVTPKLTVNLGLRYDLPGNRVETQNRYRSFDPTVGNPAVGGRLGALVGAGGQGGLKAKERSIIPRDTSNWGPRLGFAYLLFPKTVVRGGIGIYYAPVLYGVTGGGDLNNGTQGYTTTGPNIEGGADVFPDLRLKTYRSVVPPDPNNQFIGSDVAYYDPSFRTGRTVQYSLDVQHELPWNLAGTLSYIGHKGTRLKSDFNRLNALPLNALKLGDSLLNKPLGAVTASDRAYATSVGTTLPASNAAVYAGFTGNVAQALRAFPQYGYIADQTEARGHSWYNALQAKLEKRFSQNLQFGASYTFSKLITDASEDLQGGGDLGGIVQNPYDIRALRTISPGSAPHVFVINYLYELPFGTGKRWANTSTAADKLVGGWQVSMVQRYQSGFPVVIRGRSGAGFLNLFGARGDIRPNLVPGAIIQTGDTPIGTTANVLNASAFSLPPNYAAPGGSTIGDAAYTAYFANPLKFFGNAPPVLGGVRPFPFYSENLSILKKTRFTERYIFELRAEMFNVFNRHRFFQPDTDVSNPGNFGRASVDNSLYSGGYGPRIIQLGARFVF